MSSIDLGNGPSSERDFIQSIERGFAVLHAFDDEDPNPSLAELAAKTELSRPAVRRILLTLQRLGYVTSRGTRWSLTPRVLSIGQHYTASHTLVDSALPKLVEIAEYANESASLGVLDGTEVVYAARVPVRRIMSINVSVAPGPRLCHLDGPGTPGLVTARTGGSRTRPDTLRATHERDDRQPGRPARRARPGTQSGIRDHRRRTRRRLITIAAPVFDPTGHAVGVLACSTSTGRHTLDSFRDLTAKRVVDCAERLSSELATATTESGPPHPRKVADGATPYLRL